MDSDDTLFVMNDTPRHIAIIMDGNGRWAEKKFLPRAAGHQAGVKAVRQIVEYCAEQDVEVLTLFAFSSENWRRPKQEVSLLMDLFMTTLQREVDKLDKNGIRIRFIGDRTAFSTKLQQKINQAEQQTRKNNGLSLVIAANYGGRWDMCQAMRQLLNDPEQDTQNVKETDIERYLSTAGLPEPDLFIRTGGEKRISNFLLWQLAYTELYFTPTLWPDFDKRALQEAINDFKSRERRFGHTGEQIHNKKVSLLTQ